MAGKQVKREDADARARRLRMIRDEWKMPIPPDDAAWLARYDAKAQETTRIKQDRAARAAKKLGKPVDRLTHKDIEQAEAPAKPKGRAKANPSRDAELLEAAGVMEAQKEARDPKALVLARALALAAMPRNASNAATVRKQMRMGKALWVVVTYSRNKKRVPVPYGQDLLVLMALTKLMIDRDATLLSFDTIAAFLKELEESGINLSGGKGRERVKERLKRLANCTLNIAFYSSEQDAEAERNDLHTIQCVIVRRSQMFSTQDEQREEAGEQPLFPYYVELSEDYKAHAGDRKNQIWFPNAVLQKVADHPLKLQALAVVYARSLAAQGPWVMNHDDLMAEFKESAREERWLIRDLQDALAEIRTATGGKLAAEIVEDTPSRSPQGGRPKKRWKMAGRPCDALTAVHRKALKG